MRLFRFYYIEEDTDEEKTIEQCFDTLDDAFTWAIENLFGFYEVKEIGDCE